MCSEIGVYRSRATENEACSTLQVRAVCLLLIDTGVDDSVCAKAQGGVR